jgi:hypothetical protein
VHVQPALALLELPRVQPATRRQAQIDAGVTGQILRFLRRRVPGEIRGRADDLREIEAALATVRVQGDSYPAHLQQLVGR